MKKKIKQISNIVKFPKNLNKLEKQIEAIIFAADEPLDIETIEKRVQNTNNIKKILLSLQSDYSLRGVNLICIKDKWSFRTSKDLVDLMSLQKSTERKLSKATLETLAIIVYHQPVTRSEIEEIRGVAFGTNTIETVLELEWVKPAGRKDVIGKPIQYATTDNFLHHFNIQRLTDLPNVEELSSAGLIDTATIDASIFGTGKFYKEQSQNKKEDIYSNIEKAIDETPNND